MRYSVRIKDGNVRTWLETPEHKQKRFEDKAMAERWIILHGVEGLEYEAVPANVNHMTKQHKAKKPKVEWLHRCQQGGHRL